MNICFDDIDCLQDMMILESLHMDIIKENARVQHRYNITHDPEVLMEGFSDLMSGFANFFKQMIAKIKEFFQRIFAYVNSYMMDLDKFCSYYRQELNSLSDVNIRIYGHEFTLHDAPNLSCYEKVISEFNSGLAKIQSGDRRDKLKKEEILQQQREFLDSSNVEKLRGEILGTKVPESEDDFEKRVREYYRNGNADEVEVTINQAEFRSIINGASELVKLRKDAEKLRDNLIVLFSKSQNFFEKIAPMVYKDGVKQLPVKKMKVDMDKGTLTPDGDAMYVSEGNVDVVETWIRYKYNQTTTIAGIANLVARERANAYKDKVYFHKEVIRSALFGKNKNNDNTPREVTPDV